MRPLLIAGLALLGLGLLLLWGAGQLRRRTGMPVGRVVYSDTRAWRTCAEPLYAPSLKLSGKPDYLVERWSYVIPVEVKSAHAPAEPYRSHVLQLAAYCLLVEETYDRRPPYGLLHYADRTFAVPYTRELEAALEDTLAWMREDLEDGMADRSHSDPGRCRGCNYAIYCDQCLVDV